MGYDSVYINSIVMGIYIIFLIFESDFYILNTSSENVVYHRQIDGLIIKQTIRWTDGWNLIILA